MADPQCDSDTDALLPQGGKTSEGCCGGCCGGRGLAVALFNSCRAVALLGFNAFVLSQIEAAQATGLRVGTGVVPWMLNVLEVMFRIFCSPCWDGGTDDGLHFLHVARSVWIAVVLLNTLELTLSVLVLLLAVFGSRCQAMFQRFNYVAWVLLAFLQLPSFLIVSVVSLMAAVGFMVFLLFSLAGSITITYIVCAFTIALGVASLCMTFAVARAANPRHLERKAQRAVDRDLRREERHLRKQEREQRRRDRHQPPVAAPGVVVTVQAPGYPPQASYPVAPPAYQQAMPAYPLPSYATPLPTAPPAITCDRCGTQSTTAGFCGHCGQKLMM